MKTSGTWPPAWNGSWVAGTSKTVRITTQRDQAWVTVAPEPKAEPYRGAELLGGGTKLIDQLAATCWVDDDGRLYLEVEAGTDGIGPTYRLYAAEVQADGFRSPSPDLGARDLVLIPNASFGLYDDHDDDVGVPWAYPLEPLRWVSG